MRSNPLPPLQPSGHHHNSRPFTLINPLPSVHVPHLNIPSLNNQMTMEQPVFNSPAPKKLEVKCQYCNTSFASDALADHVEECNMRKIPCERCGERVLIDIYDMHFEECSSEEGQQNQGNPRIATIANIANMYMRSHAGNEIEDDNSVGDDEDNMEEEDGFFLDESEMTYERLLMLDANVVKKGMTSEQLKEFPVQLYVRSLDGEGSCVVCMCDYETGEYVRKLSCNHNFHKACIDKWLDANITCPTCKKWLR